MEELRKLGQAAWKKIVLLGRITWVGLNRYLDTDGEQRAASFAYYAFFAIPPLLLLFVMIGSVWYDYTEVARNVLDLVSRYIPTVTETPGNRDAVIETIEAVINSRKRAGAIAVLVIVWSATGFFHALVRGINRAWGTVEYPWWRLPFKNILMVCIVGSALMIGLLIPPIMAAVEAFMRQRVVDAAQPAIGGFFELGKMLLPLLVLFYGIIMFYKFAPRRRTTFGEVWLSALFATLGLKVLQKLFVLYALNISNFNAIYGAFGGVVALLMWIYLTGSVIILGGCFCAAQAEVTGKVEPVKKEEPTPL